HERPTGRDRERSRPRAMQYCTACKKVVATIHILALQGGPITGQQHLCSTSAENAGVVQPKTTPPNLSTEILEDLIGGLKGKEKEKRKGRKEGPACPACGLTVTDFKMRGRLGCPRCYEVFKKSLVPLLERVHDASSHRGRFPGRTAT